MTWRGDIDVERIYMRRPKPLCLPHLITLQYYSLLRFFVLKLATISGYLQLCPEIIYNILIVHEFRPSSSCFEHVTSISRHNAVRQTVPCIHHPISKPKLS